MDSELTIVVTRVHWHCSSCQVVNKHVVSIDQHLKSCHLDLISVATASSPCPSPDLKLEGDDFSDGDLYSELDEKTSKDELLPEMIPSPMSDKTEGTAQSETRRSQSKSETRNLSPENMSNTCETSQHMHCKIDVRTRKISSESSAGMPETVSRRKMHSCQVQKNRQSVCILTTNQKEKQRHQDNSSAGSTAEVHSEKTEDYIKQKQRPHRKRQRLQLNSCHEDVQMEHICNTHGDQSKGEDAAILKDTLKSPHVKTDKYCDSSAVKRPRTSRSGHSKCSQKPKEIFRKKLKTVDREMKKYCWGGKPVKRSLAITEKEAKDLKLTYVGSEQSGNLRKFNDTSTHKCLPPTEGNGNQNIHTILDSGAVKTNLQHPASDETLASVAGTSLSAGHGRHTDVTEACGTTETSKVNTPDLPGETCNSQSVIPFQGGSDNASSSRHDIQQSFIDSTMHREPESVAQTSSIDVVSQTPSVVCENLCLPRQCTSVSDAETPLTASTCHDLPDTDLSKVPNTEHSLTDIPQTDSVWSQQDVSQVSKTMKEEPCNFENDGNSSETEEWVKRRTNFSFSKVKTTTSFEQLSRVHECTVCQAKFSTGENLSDHVSMMSNSEPSECQDCQRPFHSAYDLNFHVFEDHERRSEPVCFDCGKKFQNMATFEKHLHHHKYNCEPKLLEMGYHSCDICQTDVPCRYETLRKHYNKHKRTICFECFVRSKLVLLPDITSVREHKTQHSNFCTVCFQDFTSAETLNDHYPCQSEFMNQEDGQGEVCGKCSQWCPNKALVTLHHKEHKLQVMRKWREEKWGVGIPCIHCDKVLRNKRNLDRHTAQMHSNCRSYNFHCEFCGKGIDDKNILKDHIAVQHLGIKRYSCEYCNQRFSCAPTLKRHILKEHVTDRQYTCEVCGERFCEKFKLTRHMYIHTGSARFMCEQCGKGCHTTSEFKKHLAVHEKQVFACQQCGQEYKRKEHLKRHYQKCTRSMQNKAQADSGIL